MASSRLEFAFEPSVREILAARLNCELRKVLAL